MFVLRGSCIAHVDVWSSRELEAQLAAMTSAPPLTPTNEDDGYSDEFAADGSPKHAAMQSAEVHSNLCVCVYASVCMCVCVCALESLLICAFACVRACVCPSSIYASLLS